ncbi:hypothetical protein CgunFtcFv8_002850 [Champsocephalus gunnari]|uniref:Uncharacterized protein n=1 Tax=Champsocephalus gunnari TaxID=52237 RepID=A0AAN8HJI1_CHAGU|nr:hypothetical protein CgunFtcFv8_002850 [Champsocephalus gunnari]
MDPSLPHTRGIRDSEARLCCCGFKISGTDSHQVCSSCLGLEHAWEAIDNPGSCGHCTRFTMKSLRRRLARQASLSGQDPLMSADSPSGNQDMVASVAEIEPRAVSDWGSTTATAAEPEPHAVSGWEPGGGKSRESAAPRCVKLGIPIGPHHGSTRGGCPGVGLHGGRRGYLGVPPVGLGLG